MRALSVYAKVVFPVSLHVPASDDDLSVRADGSPVLSWTFRPREFASGCWIHSRRRRLFGYRRRVALDLDRFLGEGKITGGTFARLWRARQTQSCAV